MMHKTSTIVQKPNAEWNMSPKSFLGSQRGSGLSIIFLGFTVTLLILLIFLSIADYAVYSTKRNTISRGIDYAVCAAIQEIDCVESEEGLASGFDEVTGKTLVDDIVINEARADNTFFSTLQMNTGINSEAISSNTMIVTLSPRAEGMDYNIHNGQQRVEGSVSSTEQLEPVINNAVERFWDGADPKQDSQVIYINGNPKTNQFKKVPYYLVFIKDYQINGLLKRRTATFVGFAGAKIERRK